MGNRCVISTEEKDLAVYMHWNGGRDTIEPLLAFCKMAGYRNPENDSYGWAKLVAVATNAFGEGGMTVGVSLFDKAHCKEDNGLYIIRDWKIVGREFFTGAEQSEHKFKSMLKFINRNQPKHEQLKNIDALIAEYQKKP